MEEVLTISNHVRGPPDVLVHNVQMKAGPDARPQTEDNQWRICSNTLRIFGIENDADGLVSLVSGEWSRPNRLPRYRFLVSLSFQEQHPVGEARAVVSRRDKVLSACIRKSTNHCICSRDGVEPARLRRSAHHSHVDGNCP